MKRKWLWIGIGGVLTVLLLVVGLSRSSGSKMTPVQFARVRVEDITARVRAPARSSPRPRSR